MQGYDFTERTRKVIDLAREEAQRRRHGYVGPEHLLLGLLDEGEGVATAVLELLAAPPDLVRRRLEEVVPPGESNVAPGTALPFTSRAKKSLELAMVEATELGHPYVGTEHLLLGILREERGIAPQVLREFGVTIELARAEVLRLLGQPGENVLVAAAGPAVAGVGVEVRYADGSVVRGDFTSLMAAMRFLGRQQG